MEEDIELSKVDIKNKRYNFIVKDIKNIVGQKTAYLVQKGEAIYNWNLSKNLLFKKRRCCECCFKKR